MLFAYETERLFLRINKPDAAEAVLDFYLRDKELFEKYEPDRMNNFYTVLFQKQVLAFEYNLAVQNKLFRFYVYEKYRRQRIIGTVCVHNITRGYTSSCEIGYKFSSNVHHRGYATEALRLMLELMFREQGLHRIEAWVMPENISSIHLLERVGFSYEGLCRGCLLLQGQWRDHAQYAILSSDYRSSSSHIQ